MQPEGFGAFAPLFEDSIAYLTLLNCDHGSKDAIALVMKCCAAVSNPYRDICQLLRQPNWRPNLVGAVAIAALGHDPEATSQLWVTIDRGSWVTPQLAATAFLRDPQFTDHALERLQRGAMRSAKAASSLVHLLQRLPPRSGRVIVSPTSAEINKLLNEDKDSSGKIAECWLIALTRNLGALGVSL